MDTQAKGTGMSQRTDEVIENTGQTELSALPEQGGASATSLQHSWGDRFKKSVFNKNVYFGLNYLGNAIGSAAFAYMMERKFELHIKNSTQSLGQKWTSSPAAAEKLGAGLFGVVRAFLVTSVGTALIPVIKKLEDNRHRLQYGIGHRLDQLQEALGKGNEASQQNLKDYYKVKGAMVKPGSVEFSDEERERLWKKHRIELTDRTDKVTFNEHKLPWAKVIVARLAGYLAVVSTNFALHATKKNGNEWLNYDAYEKKAAGKLNTVFSKIPGYNKLVADPEHFAGMLFNDALLTASSATTHKCVQGKLHKDPESEEMPARKSTHIQKIIENGPKEFRTRAEDTQQKEYARTY